MNYTSKNISEVSILFQSMIPIAIGMKNESTTKQFGFEKSI